MRLKDDSIEMRITDPVFNAFICGPLDKVYREWGDEVVITSGSEMSAKHSSASLHYAGRAIDIRTWHGDARGKGVVPPPDAQRQAVWRAAKEYLESIFFPANFIDVVLESTHIHIEWQPKRQS